MGRGSTEMSITSKREEKIENTLGMLSNYGSLLDTIYRATKIRNLFRYLRQKFENKKSKIL